MERKKVNELTVVSMSLWRWIVSCFISWPMNTSTDVRILVISIALPRYSPHNGEILRVKAF